MKLAEALVLRADAMRQVERLRERIVGSSRYQEGEPPAEDAAQLLAEARAALDELESLIRRINKTNAASQLDTGTITDAIAKRDVLRMRHSLLTTAADAASGQVKFTAYGTRQLRSELVVRSALPVPELRAEADDLARQIREVDAVIQRANWEVDLLD